MISSVFNRVIASIKIVPHIYLWRKQNRHNYTHAVNYFTRDCVDVGKCTYGPIEILYDSGIARIHIGNYCSIAKNVKFFAGGAHDYRRISTYPFQTLVYKGYGIKERYENLDINVEDDVWVGYDCIILPGTRIGKGSVIGARSVVTGVIPPYSVYVGNKVIKSRFPKNIVDILNTIDFSSIKHENGDSYQRYCMEHISDENIDEIFKAFVGR